MKTGRAAWGRSGPGRVAGLVAAITLTTATVDACGGASNSRPSASSAAAVSAQRGDDGVQRITVEARDDYRFAPSTVAATPGQIEITVRNVGLVPHNLVVRGVPGAAVDYLDGGASKTVRFSVDRAGRLPFVCTYHEQMGMTGTLVVQ